MTDIETVRQTLRASYTFLGERPRQDLALDALSRIERVVEAARESGESFHDLSEDPEHRGTLFMRRPGHDPGLLECSDHHCARLREALGALDDASRGES